MVFKQKHSNGLLLIDSVVLIVVLGVMIFPATSIFMQILQENHKIEITAKASALAEEKMEQVLGQVFSAIDDDGLSFQDFEPPFQDYSFDISVREIDGEPIENYKGVFVTVRHPMIEDVSLFSLSTSFNSND